MKRNITRWFKRATEDPYAVAIDVICLIGTIICFLIIFKRFF